MDVFNSATLLAIGTAIGAILAALFKYLLDKRKQDHSHKIEVDKLETDWVQKEFIRLTTRIIELEKAYQNCVKGEAERERVIGRLTGEVEGLKSLVVQLQRNSSKIIAEQAIERTTEVIESKVQTAVDSAIEKKSE